MKKGIILGILIMILLSVAGYFFYDAQKTVTEIKEVPVKKSITYRFTLKNTTEQLITGQTFWVYAPVEKNASQQVEKIKASHPYELIKDKYNNQILAFPINNLAPFSRRIIRIQVALTLSKNLHNMPLLDTTEYLVSTENINIQDPKIKQLSATLKQSETKESAYKAYQWVAANIKYTGYKSKQLNASDTLKTLAGDCTEYMHLLSTINRINQIPTREIGGYVVSQSPVLKAYEYHNWNEIYMDGQWHISDAQKKNHLKGYQNYIAFHNYGNDPLNPLNNAHRYKVSDQRINVKMK